MRPPPIPRPHHPNYHRHHHYHHHQHSHPLASPPARIPHSDLAPSGTRQIGIKKIDKSEETVKVYGIRKAGIHICFRSSRALRTSCVYQSINTSYKHVLGAFPATHGSRYVSLSVKDVWWPLTDLYFPQCRRCLVAHHRLLFPSAVKDVLLPLTDLYFPQL